MASCSGKRPQDRCRTKSTLFHITVSPGCIYITKCVSSVNSTLYRWNSNRIFEASHCRSTGLIYTMLKGLAVCLYSSQAVFLCNRIKSKFIFHPPKTQREHIQIFHFLFLKKLLVTWISFLKQFSLSYSFSFKQMPLETDS